MFGASLELQTSVVLLTKELGSLALGIFLAICDLVLGIFSAGPLTPIFPPITSLPWMPIQIPGVLSC